jgi:hypothetical protein
MNITSVQSVLAPILAPIAPAVLFGNNLYNGMLSDQIDPTFALIAAIGGTAGVEISGALACSMAVLAYHKKDFKIMWISIISSLIYAWFVFNGISQSKNAATFAGAVVISLIAYLMLGVFQSYQYKLSSKRDEVSIEIGLLDARRKLTNSETRKAKAGVSNTVFTEQNEQTEQLNSAALAMVCEYLSQYPESSARDLLRIPGIPFTSPATASKYRKAAEEMLK